MRVGLLVPDLPTGFNVIDICIHDESLGNTGTFEIGPIAMSLGVAAGGFSYPEVTRYMALHAASYDTRIVAPNSTDCSTTLFGTQDTTNAFTVTADVYTTTLAVGRALGTPALAFVTTTDSTFSASANSTDLRFFNAQPNRANGGGGTPASLDLGDVASGTFSALFTDVGYGTLAQTTGGSYLSYPVGSPQFRLRQHSNGNTLVTATAFPTTDGDVYSVFAVGSNQFGSQAQQVLICQDQSTLAVTGDVFSTCQASP
jgi:hypothetical protein